MTHEAIPHGSTRRLSGRRGRAPAGPLPSQCGTPATKAGCKGPPRPAGARIPLAAMYFAPGFHMGRGYVDALEVATLDGRPRGPGEW